MKMLFLSMLMTSILMRGAFRRAETGVAQRNRSALIAKRQRRGIAQHRFGLRGRPAVLVVEHQARQQRERRAAALAGAHQHADRRLHRRGREPAAPRCRRNGRRARPAPRPARRRARSASAFRRNAAATPQPPIQSASKPPLRRMRRAAAGIGRDILPRRIVERRIHQHAIGRARADSPRAANSSAAAVTSSVTARARPVEAVARDILGGDVGKLRIDLHQRHVDVRDPHRQRKPAAPTPAPKSTARSPGRAAVAAASRMASWPTRWPRFFCFSRSRPPSTASSVVSGFWPRPDRRPQLVAEAGVLQKLARDLLMLVVDQDAARQDAERAFQHAHVLIEHHMRDVGALEQRLDRGDQHRVVGADEFVHGDPSAPPPLFGRRALRQIGQQLQLAPAARHGVEDQPQAIEGHASSISPVDSTAVGSRGTMPSCM